MVIMIKQLVNARNLLFNRSNYFIRSEPLNLFLSILSRTENFCAVACVAAIEISDLECVLLYFDKYTCDALLFKFLRENMTRPLTFCIQRSSDKSNMADLYGHFCFHFGHRSHDRARILDLIFL